MALIKCPEYGKENVSDTAKACPECGYVLHQHNKKVFQVNYLANKWGTGSNAFYIWAGFVSLLWFVTQATNLMVDEEF